MKNYIIKLMSGDEISITEEEFLKMKGKQGAVYVPSINQIINLNRIERVYAGNDKIQKEFRLNEPKKEEGDDKRIKVLGGFTTPSMRERMIRLFNQLKKVGRFREFKNYFDWEKTTYGQR